MENNVSNIIAKKEEPTIFVPLDFAEANSWLEGRNVQDEESQYTNEKEIKGIKCYKDGGVVITRWQIKSIWQRIKFVFTGEINVVVMGPTQPPMAIRLDSPFINNQNN